MTHAPLRPMVLGLLLLLSAANLSAQHTVGQRDFDFELGKWTTQLKRLTKPLTGSTTWVEYRGTSTVS
jgi:hypothetical protein